MGLALLGALVAASCSSGGRRAVQSTTTAPATTVAPPTSTTQPAPAYAPSPYSWERNPSAPLEIGGGATATLAAILAPALSEPWMVVGTKLSAAGTPSATLWTSPDGVGWSAAPLTAPGEAGHADGATQYHGATVVVGAVGEGANQQATVWLSPTPGAPFTPAQVPESDGPSTISLVADGALGLFAVGTVDGRFAMWSSTNGRQWGELSGAERAITSSPGARVNALMAEDDVVYAAGSIQPGPDSQAAVWSTGDGLHWRLVTTAGSAFGAAGSRVIYSLAPLATGLVAVGAIDRGTGWSPASWISPDGLSWSQPAVDFPGIQAGAAPVPDGSVAGSAALAVSAITTFAGSTAVVAAGGGSNGRGVWKSSDGLHWSSIALPPAAAASTAWRPTLVGAIFDETVVVDGDPGQPRLLTDRASGWSQPSADPNVFGPVQATAHPVRAESEPSGLVLEVRVTAAPQTIGPAVSTVRFVSTADGQSWVGVPAATMVGYPASVPVAGATVVRSAGGGWVATANSGTGGSASGGPEAWVSTSGAAWTPVGALDPPSGPGGRPAAAVIGACASGTGAGVVAVGSQVPPGPLPAGSDARSAAAWVSVDGLGWRRAPVSPAPAPGGRELMYGCLDSGSGLVAYGMTTSSGGAPAPGLWRSTAGATWNRQGVAAFGADTPSPLTDVAVSGSDWIAVAGAAAPGTATGPGPSVESGTEGIWLSSDDGATWQRSDLAVAPWLGAVQAQVDVAAFAGPIPVIAGAVDGRLTVWEATASASVTTASGG